jgi:nitrite reductase (NADH) large subunit
VRLKGGRSIAADLVVMAAGIVPNLDLAKAAGLPCERGLLVNDTLQTFDPRVYAVGECVQHRKAIYGLVAPLYEQARVCANHLAGAGTTRYAGSIVSTRLKVTGVELFSAGNFLGGDGTRDLVYKDARRGVYKRLVLKQNRLEGAVLYGEAADGGWYFDLIRTRRDISAYRDRLLFGRRHVIGNAAAA